MTNQPTASSRSPDPVAGEPITRAPSEHATPWEPSAASEDEDEVGGARDPGEVVLRGDEDGAEKEEVHERRG